ncbi:MAG: hypothetical protein JWO31_1875 [Phycisphaerales bacterium]|nr:hypothetical protein [Phycisphaerales bacterium]
MDLSTLTSEQRQELLQAVYERSEWFGKLRERMAAQHWPDVDPFYAVVGAAHAAGQRVVETIKAAEQEAWARAAAGSAYDRLYAKLGRDPKGRVR